MTISSFVIDFCIRLNLLLQPARREPIFLLMNVMPAFAKNFLHLFTNARYPFFCCSFFFYLAIITFYSGCGLYVNAQKAFPKCFITTKRQFRKTAALRSDRYAWINNLAYMCFYLLEIIRLKPALRQMCECALELHVPAQIINITFALCGMSVYWS